MNRSDLAPRDLSVNRASPIAIFLVVIGVFIVIVVAAGPGGGENESRAPAGEAGSLSSVATPREYELWNERGCVTCHGLEARGTPMGPDLTKVIPLYLAKTGSAAAARDALAAYLLDPAGRPKLRVDGEVFPNPMPPLGKLFGGNRDEAPVLAEMLLRLAK